jgi:hypothetical protein
MRLLGSLPEGQALDIGLHYAVTEDLTRPVSFTL